MRFSITRVISVFFVLMGVITSVNAATIYSQTPAHDTGQASDIDANSYVADDFALSSNDTIRSVIWRGFYCCDGTPPATDNFSINFYSDNSGAPGGLINSFYLGAVVDRFDTGLNFLTLDYYEYKADLGSGLSLSSGSYWVSIFTDTAPDVNDDFTWAMLDLAGNSRYSTLSSASFPNIGNGEMYFVLDNANVSAVPLPAAAWLFGLGLAGLVGFARRKENI